MRKTVVMLFGVALLTATWGGLLATAAAKDMKPVAVWAFAGYDEIKSDIAYVGRISDNPDLDKNLEAVLKLFTRNQGLAGLDKSRPWGAVIQTDGQDITGYAFVPVSDLKQLLGVLQPFIGDPKDAGNGVMKIEKGPKPNYFKEIAGGWVIMSDKPETLAAAPTDPAAAVAELNKQYDIAARVYAQNVPAAMRSKFIENMRRDVDRDLKRRSSEKDEDYVMRVKVTRDVVQSIEQLANDLDQVTLGWSLDSKTEKAFLDVSLVLKPGSPTAEQTAKALADTKTNYAGFRLPGAAVLGNVDGQMVEAKKAIVDEIVAFVRKQALAGIDKEPKSDEEKKIARDLVREVLTVVEQTVKQGRVDSAMSLVLEPKAVTFVAAGRLVDAPRLEKVARQVTGIVKNANPTVGGWIKLDADQWQSVKFHTVSIPIPADAKDREKAVQLLGETLDVAIGLGPDSIYVGVGRNALSTLKQAVEKSAAGAQGVTPLQLSVALRPIAEFVAVVGEAKDRPKAAAIAKELATPTGLDHINVLGQAIPNGVRYRIEIEPGVVRLLGKLPQLNLK